MEEKVIKVVVQKNGIGTAGFVLALIGLVFCWVPVLDFILLLLGFIFSFIGLFKRPVGLAVAGLVISIIGSIVMVVAVLGLAALAAL